MKKIYQRPDTEIVATKMERFLGISGEVDGNPQIPYGGDDDPTNPVPAESKSFSLWDEEGV